MNSAEIITIGDEILIGQTVDTNSAWIGTELNLIGIRVNRIISVSDRREEIMSALDGSLERADIVLVTGGLGPTSDDITKQTLADYFGAEMVINEDVLKNVTERLSRRGISMNENNRRQALVPENCTVLSNHAGTAPGMLFMKDGRMVVSMPGVPHEMKQLMNEHVLPMLAEKYRGKVIIHKNIMTYGTSEAKLAERLEERFEKELPTTVRLAYLPAFGIIKLRLTATGNDEAEAKNTLKEQVKKLYMFIPDVIYGEDEVTLEEAVGNLLNERHMTVCTAESCTGGKIASLITSVPGSSDWYKGSVVAYDNSIKNRILGVSNDTLHIHGAVSRETAEEMARSARRLMDTDFAIAVTGIAGPTGGTPEKPVGTVWIAIASEKMVTAEKQAFADDRKINITRSSFTALNMLRKLIIAM
jgi:nicotinamide-nucleotide amidase